MIITKQFELALPAEGQDFAETKLMLPYGYAEKGYFFNSKGQLLINVLMATDQPHHEERYIVHRNDTDLEKIFGRDPWGVTKSLMLNDEVFNISSLPSMAEKVEFQKQQAVAMAFQQKMRGGDGTPKLFIPGQQKQ